MLHDMKEKGVVKLIWGLPGDEDAPTCKAPGCKNGWQQPPALRNASWPAAEWPENATFSPGVWLFNLTADEQERTNLASSECGQNTAFYTVFCWKTVRSFAKTGPGQNKRQARREKNRETFYERAGCSLTRRPEIVAFLRERIASYNSSHVWQANQVRKRDHPGGGIVQFHFFNDEFTKTGSGQT